jgi:methionyl-tRNA formyltransferase
MRLAFMGTPAFAVPALDALVAGGHQVAAVYTQPPRPANRGRITPSPVQLRAEQLGIEVRTPERLRSPETQAAFAALGLEATVVAAYGLILPAAILNAPRHGCINIHASLLPRWRGAAPVQRAIMAGDRETGITIMRMDRGLDTGPMLLKRPTEIGSRDTAGELANRLGRLGAEAIVDALARLDGLRAEPQQEDAATYAGKIDKAEARIDWTREATYLERLVRAMAPAPGAWFQWQGERVKLLMARVIPEPADTPPGTFLEHGRVATGDGILQLETVQPAGSRAMPVEDWLRGRAPRHGERLD